MDEDKRIRIFFSSGHRSRRWYSVLLESRSRDARFSADKSRRREGVSERKSVELKTAPRNPSTAASRLSRARRTTSRRRGSRHSRPIAKPRAAAGAGSGGRPDDMIEGV